MKTLAIRLEEDRHAQLSVLAQLAGRTITDEIREAIERHIEARKTDPELTMKAEGVLEEIERKAQERQAAIATLFGVKNINNSDTPEGGPGRPNGRKKPSARIKVGFVS
jgi:predicted DNA-binding protein